MNLADNLSDEIIKKHSYISSNPEDNDVGSPRFNGDIDSLHACIVSTLHKVARLQYKRDMKIHGIKEFDTGSLITEDESKGGR